MIKWLEKKFQNMGTQDAIRDIKEEVIEEPIEEKEMITLDCDGVLTINISEEKLDEDLYWIQDYKDKRYRIELDYDVDIYFKNNLESIKSKGSIFMNVITSEQDAYLFMIKENENGAVHYMKELKERVISDFNTYIEKNEVSVLKQIVKQQKPIEVKFTVKV